MGGAGAETMAAGQVNVATCLGFLRQGNLRLHQVVLARNGPSECTNGILLKYVVLHGLHRGGFRVFRVMHGFEGQQSQVQGHQAMDAYLQGTTSKPSINLPNLRDNGMWALCRLGVPTEEGQRGFIHDEGQRLPCACFGGRLVIDTQPTTANQSVRDNLDDRPRPPPGPPPPTPPTMPKVVSYGASVVTSRTPGGTPVPLPPDNIEEPSKLQASHPATCERYGRGRCRSDGGGLAGTTWTPSMATLSPGAAPWWKDLLREVMGSFSTWLESSPIVRLTLRQKILADVPPLDRFQRVEQRAAMLLLECLPEDLRAEAISTRATSVKGMPFLTLCCYQEGREAQLAAVPDHPRGSLQFGFRGHLSKGSGFVRLSLH